MVRTKTGREIELLDRVLRIEGVQEGYIVTGSYDLLVDIQAKHEKELGRIAIKIRGFKDAVDAQTMLVVDSRRR